MSNFLRPNKSKLKNAQHFAFIEAFLTAIGQVHFTAAKITTLVTSLTEAFRDEDRWYMISRKSELIAQRDEADRQRDSLYGRLHQLVRAWAGSGIAPLDAPATRVKKVFDLYKVRTSAQIDEETGQLDNLIADLSTEAMQADLTALGATELFTQLTAAQRQVKSIRLDEGTEQSEKVVGALASARKECDRLYDELTYLIEAFSLTVDDPAQYDGFIKQWNGTLKIYQDMLDRKQNSSSGSGSGSGGSSSGGSSSGGSSDSGGSGSGDGGSGDSGSGDGGGSQDGDGGGSGSGDSGSGDSGSGDGDPVPSGDDSPGADNLGD